MKKNKRTFSNRKNAESFSSKVKGETHVKPNGKITVTYLPTGRPYVNERPALLPEQMNRPEWDDYAFTEDDF